ncbi:MAG: hypothetical protein JWL70_2015 [Acidimicrobiia bacterium]|nr:hypothetical protein [Acidimicrobiia bacterium]
MASSNVRIRPATIGCVALAVVLVVVAIVYFTKTADGLPSFFPGHESGSTHHHVKHGIAVLALAALSLVAAWFTTAPDRTQ